MKMRYENTIEDVVAFTRYHYAHSPRVRQTRLASTFAISLFIVAVTASLAKGDELPLYLGIGVGLAAVYVLISRRVWGWSMERQARRIYAEGQNKGMLGPHELELTDTHLTDRTPYHEGITRLEAVEKVVRAGDYTFIYMSALTAHVIPRKSVVEGDYDQFVEAVADRLAVVKRAEDGEML